MNSFEENAALPPARTRLSRALSAENLAGPQQQAEYLTSKLILSVAYLPSNSFRPRGGQQPCTEHVAAGQRCL